MVQRFAVLQMTSAINPQQNINTLRRSIASAAEEGAAMLFTPEMSGLIDQNRERAAVNIYTQDNCPVLAAVRETAAKSGIWVGLGSLAFKREGGRLANRSLVINGNGDIAASYDKIHMFDVDLANGGSWRESAHFVPGDKVVAVETPLGKLGLAICYDLRFPALFESLGREKCDLISIPAAFTVPTGLAHWHILNRARAIEASAYVIAAAQSGRHDDGRDTYGHSLAIDPWGKVLFDLGCDGDSSGKLGFGEISHSYIAEVRNQIPSLANRRETSR